MIVVIGKSGQLAKALSRLLQDSKIEHVCLGRNEINLFSEDDTITTICSYSPTAIINASAYTAVDKAESDQANACQINATALGYMVTASNLSDARLLHVSTDYVFSGNKGSPYLPGDPVNPCGVYGDSKALGEKALMSNVKSGKASIIRTSWVYSEFGDNFVKTMLRLMRDKPFLKVVDDQIGSPTSVWTLARTCILGIEKGLYGIHHLTDEGVASWYDFACAIQRLAFENNILSQKVPIYPVPSSLFKTIARRPSYSVLDKGSIKHELKELGLMHWENELNRTIKELKRKELL